MTYEQGGSGRAGLGVVVDNGDTLTLKDRISHHLTTGLSTVEVASRQSEVLNTEFRKYYSRKHNFKYQAYLLKGDPDKQQALTRLLDQHEITYGWASPGRVKGFHYGEVASGSLSADEKTLVVPTQQKKGVLVKVLFEPDARLSDSLTYDITAWSLPYAYGLEALAAESGVQFQEENPAGNSPSTTGVLNGAYAHLSDWSSMKDARFLADLLKTGVRVRRAEQPFRQDGMNWGRGSLIISRADNGQIEDFYTKLDQIAKKHQKRLTPVKSGLVESGKDFGSRYVGEIRPVKVAVLSGDPTSTLRFGEVWHFFEQQLQYPVTVLDADYFDRVDLGDYDVLILPGGWGYRNFLNANRKAELKEWVASGGRLIAMGNAISSLGGDGGFGIQRKQNGSTDTTALPRYAETRRDRIRESITGAIFKTIVDPTHPLAFGFADSYFTLKLGSSAYELSGPGAVSFLGDAPQPVAGFAGNEALKNLPGSLVIGMENHGSGAVVYLADNPLFRGFWENGKLFFANALFMVTP
jgi:putative intracellular protease/amidase